MSSTSSMLTELLADETEELEERSGEMTEVGGIFGVGRDGNLGHLRRQMVSFVKKTSRAVEIIRNDRHGGEKGCE